MRWGRSNNAGKRKNSRKPLVVLIWINCKMGQLERCAEPRTLIMVALESPRTHGTLLSKNLKTVNKKELIMKRKEQSVLLAGLLALGLAACSSTGMNGTDTASTITSETSGEAAYSTPPMDTTGRAGSTASTTGTETGSTASGASSMGSSGAQGTSGYGTGSQAQARQPSSVGTETITTSGTPNSVVTAIDVVPRQAAGGAGTVAGAAVGGTTGSASDRVYRITLRMDDGTSRIVTQESAPAFKTGDRVRMTDETMQQQR